MDIQIDASDFTKMAQRLQFTARTIRNATERGLDAAAIAGRRAVQEEIRSRFDRPTPWVVASVRARLTQNHNMESQVYIRDEGNKSGGSAVDLFTAETQGGTREWKRFEKILQRAGMLGPGEQAVPGERAKIDAYGNMSKGQIIQIISWFQAFGEQGYKANITDAGKKRIKGGRNRRVEGAKFREFGTRYFFLRGPRGRGIYQSTKRGGKGARWDMQPVLMFVRRATYRPRLDMVEAVVRVARPAFEGTFAEVLRAAR